MEYFLNDYSNFGDKSILEKMAELSGEINEGYSEGKYSKKVSDMISSICKADANVFFLSGGTQTNAIVIASQLKRFEAVIAATTGHINVHEAGSVENLGHKIVTVPSYEGKIKPEDIQNAVILHEDMHMVCPKMAYITQPTELGTMYSKSELAAIKKVCEKNNLLLFIDGARLAVALAKDKKITLKDYFDLTDMFYFGGTKCGLPLGEMLIIKNKDHAKDFRYFMKQYGALLAKGEFIAAMFKELLENDKYLTLASNSIKKSEVLVEFLKSKKIKFKYTPQTNQLFPILSNKQVQKLAKEVKFCIWESDGKNNTVIRLVTSFSTTDSEISNFINIFNKI